RCERSSRGTVSLRSEGRGRSRRPREDQKAGSGFCQSLLASSACLRSPCTAGCARDGLMGSKLKKAIAAGSSEQPPASWLDCERFEQRRPSLVGGSVVSAQLRRDKHCDKESTMD